jgi:glutamine cyclotransferase
MPWRKRHLAYWIVLIVFAVLAGAVYIAVARYGMYLYLTRQKSSLRGVVIWEDLGEVPMASSMYTPQGMTWVNGRILFANSWKNTRSRVYEFDPETMTSLRHFDMPEGAVHTSGLAWDGVDLWAVDFISNDAYCLDLEASLASGEAQVKDLFTTTLKGTSACCFVPWHGETCLAISDFMHSRRTILVRHQDALARGTADGCIEFEYRNEGFSQGLEFAEGFLYESENKAGNDVINRIDLELLQKTGNARKATVRQLNAPNGGVEDLAWDGQYMWTSDEKVFRFFRSPLDSTGE